MFCKIRVRVEEYAYYVNKHRLKAWIWRQIVPSETAHTKYKWPPYATEWTPNMKIFCVRHWLRSSSFLLDDSAWKTFESLKKQLEAATLRDIDQGFSNFFVLRPIFKKFF